MKLILLLFTTALLASCGGKIYVEHDEPALVGQPSVEIQVEHHHYYDDE